MFATVVLAVALAAGLVWTAPVLVGAASDGGGGWRSLVSGEPGADDGRLGEGATVTVDDTRAPAIARLQPALRAALGRADEGAARAGVTLEVNSGWRSRRYQQVLLDEAEVEYGSREEALRWVATPDTSPHVSGDAVDIAPESAASWLGERGAAFGLCRVYDNEPWHFELRPDAATDGCPATYPTPANDPRLD